MTEVRETSPGSFALYATRPYEPGEIILSEPPLFTFAPTSAEQDAAVASQFAFSSDASVPTPSSSSSSRNNKKKKKNRKKATATSLADVKPPLNSPVGPDDLGKFRGMLLALATYVLSDDAGVKSKVLSLYRPSLVDPNDDERRIVTVAREAAKYASSHAAPGSELERFCAADDGGGGEEGAKVMLVWSCNAFAGGLLYERASRVNHSCDPNCVVSTAVRSSAATEETAAATGPRADDVQSIRAAASIDAGDEITISYLGIVLYAGGRARDARLRRTKHFACRCDRCRSPDVASAIPCPSCHPRVLGKFLEEEVQYDDAGDVRYARPDNAENDGRGVRCERCDEAASGGGVLTLVNKVSEKVATRLVTLDVSGDAAAAPDNEQRSIDAEIDEQLYQMSSTVLGAKHWSTNLILLSLLDRSLKSFSSDALLNQTAPDDVEVAESIDSLQRIYSYVEGLNLKVHPGHLLCDQVVGVSRTLVSMGDEKSQKYGSEWIGRVAEYVTTFEGEGMQKVVDALSVAWQRKDKGLTSVKDEAPEEDGEHVEAMEEEEGGGGSNKRPKVG